MAKAIRRSRPPRPRSRRRCSTSLQPSNSVKVASIALAACAAFAFSQESNAQRSGKEVVESTCIACHGAGKDRAPKIGDRQAWKQRSAQGLSSLTQTALKGIRNMPPHGGNPGLTDLELARGITYMVNASGGKWTEPTSDKDLKAERSGAQVVKMQCSKCHEDRNAILYMFNPKAPAEVKK